MDFNEWIDKLLSQIDIVKVIGRYIPLTRKGKTWWGCCPFHHEKDPSFAVNEDKQFYHCFGCKESGNAITFVSKMESIERIDAIKMLAAEAKMEMPKLESQRGEGVSREKRERLYSLMREAAKHYHENLYGKKAKNALDYIEARQIPQALVKRFGLGVSVDGSEMLNYLESKGYTKAEMKEAGIAEQRGADWYDVFYGRFMIPVINNFGEVVAFGGRLITPETHTPVKYRNSSATVIFDKSKTLYAINLLKKKKQKENIDYVIIAEGYMDVIALHKAGFDTAVASMGTALTFSQAKLIRNYSNNVYISYDGDGAGQTATMRGLDILKEAGLNVKVISLPDGLDPDDLIKERGRDAYARLIEEALPLTAFKLKVLKTKYDPTDKEGKVKYAIEAAKIIKALENPIEQDEYLRAVHQDTGYSMEVLRQQAEVSTVEKPEKARYNGADPVKQAEKQENQQDGKRDRAELFVIASIAHAQPYVDYDGDVYAYLTDESYRKVYEYALSRFKLGEKPSVSVLYSLVEPSVAAEIAGYEFLAGDGENKYKSCLMRLKIRSIEQEKEKIIEKIKATNDYKLLPELQRLDGLLRSLKTGGEDD